MKLAIVIKKLSKIKFELFWIFLGQLFTVIGTLVGIKIITNVVSPNIYGQVALSLTLVTFINQIMLGPLSASALRYYSLSKEKENTNAYFTILIELYKLLSYGIIFFCILVSLVLIIYERYEMMLLIVFTVTLALLMGYNAAFNGIQNAARNRKIVAFHQTAVVWVKFIAAYMLVVVLGANSAVVLIGFAISYLIIICSQLIFINKIFSFKSESVNNKELKYQIINYAWPFSTWGIFSWAHMVSDKWILEFYSTTAEVGLYSILYQLSINPIRTFSSMLLSLVSPILFQKAGDASDSKRMLQVHQLIKVLSIFIFISVLIVVLFSFYFHELIFYYLVSSEYSEISWLMPGLVLSGGFFTLGQVISVKMMSDNTSQKLISPKIMTAIFGIMFNLIGVKYFGLVGLVIANNLTFMIYTIWMYLLFLRTKLLVENSSTSC